MTYATHRLKVDRKYWPALVDGRKTFEVRRNDRDFQAGDVLELTPFDPSAPPGPPATELWTVEVSYVLHTFPEGLQPGYVVLGLVPR